MSDPAIQHMREALQRLHDSIPGDPETARRAVATPETLEEFTRAAAAEFERAMAPVRGAIVGALQEGGEAEIKGLRAMLPHMLRNVIAQPGLEDLLAHQLGRAVLDGFLEETRAMEGGAS